MRRLEGVAQLTAQWLAERQSGTFEGYTREIDRNAGAVSKVLRWHVPRKHSMANFLRERLTIAQGCSQWRLWGVTTIAEAISEVHERG